MQYVKKKGLQLLFCSIAIFRCFMGVQSCLLLLVFVCLYIYIYIYVHIFVLVKNDVLLLVPTGNVLELGFPNDFSKRLTNCGKIVSCLRKYSKKLCQMTRNLQSFSYSTNFPFTTSETMYDYYLQTWYIRVSSRSAERLKAEDLMKLGNIRKLSKLDKIIA